MKKIIFILSVVLIGAVNFSQADATYVPLDGNVFDLDHYYAFEWGVDLGFSTADTPIVEAYLEFDNIRNWTNEDTDVLYVDLLEGDHVGLMAYRDRAASGDYFDDGQGFRIVKWTDDTDTVGSDESFQLSSGAIDALNQYGADGVIGLGIDPDCHYWNDGARFKVVTSAVPAPGAVALGSIGLVTVGWLRRRKVL